MPYDNVFKSKPISLILPSVLYAGRTSADSIRTQDQSISQLRGTHAVSGSTNPKGCLTCSCSWWLALTGHSFHQSCIEATLGISATTADGLRYKVGKCAVCSKGQALLRKGGDVSPYSRIWLSTQDHIDTDILPLTIRFDDQSQTNLNIIALAGLAKTDVDTIKASLEKDLGAFEPECSGTVKALQTSSSSFFTAIQDLERVLTRVKHVQTQEMLVVRRLSCPLQSTIHYLTNVYRLRHPSNTLKTARPN